MVEAGELVRHAEKAVDRHGAEAVWASAAANLRVLDFGDSIPAEAVNTIIDVLAEYVTGEE